MGSDYNFIYSSEMREKINENCLDDNCSTYMNFQEYQPIDYRVQRMLASNGRENDSGDTNEIDNHIHEVVYQSFLNSNLHMQNGFVLGIYRIFGLASAIFSLSGILNDEKQKIRTEVSPIRALNIYSICLPIVAVLYDFTVQRIINRYEYNALKVAKISCVVLYWALMVYAYVQYMDDVASYSGRRFLETENNEEDTADNDYKKLSSYTKSVLYSVDMVAFAYPIAAMVYSKMIYDCKFLTKASTRESRISPNVSRNNGIQFNEDGLPIPRNSDGEIDPEV